MVVFALCTIDTLSLISDNKVKHCDYIIMLLRLLARNNIYIHLKRLHDLLVLLILQGDGNIRYYEIVNEAPFTHYLSQYQSGSPQRGLGMYPAFLVIFAISNYPGLSD